jgi:hypothetical protein
LVPVIAKRSNVFSRVGVNPASRKPGGTGPIVESNLWNRKPFTGRDATSLASLFRIHRSGLLMGANRRGAAVRDPTFGSIMR